MDEIIPEMPIKQQNLDAEHVVGCISLRESSGQVT